MYPLCTLHKHTHTLTSTTVWCIFAFYSQVRFLFGWVGVFSVRECGQVTMILTDERNASDQHEKRSTERLNAIRRGIFTSWMETRWNVIMFGWFIDATEKLLIFMISNHRKCGCIHLSFVIWKLKRTNWKWAKCCRCSTMKSRKKSIFIIIFYTFLSVVKYAILGWDLLECMRNSC